MHAQSKAQFQNAQAQARLHTHYTQDPLAIVNVQVMLD